MVTRLIPLTKGLFAKVSPEDFRTAIKRKWCASKRSDGEHYAQTNMKIDGKWTRVNMHTYLMKPPPGIQVDHKDRDSLNNTRENLRLATHNQNMHNTKVRKGTYKGVSQKRDKKGRLRNKWGAQIMVDRKYHYLGVFNSPEDAARAYDAKAKEFHGDFAWLNFPTS